MVVWIWCCGFSCGWISLIVDLAGGWYLALCLDVVGYCCGCSVGDCEVAYISVLWVLRCLRYRLW